MLCGQCRLHMTFTTSPSLRGRKEVRLNASRRIMSFPLRSTTLALMAAVSLGSASQALAQEDPIKVGILHSLSGTMAISESTLKDTVEMLIAQQNEQGGLLGRQLEAVVVDPASGHPVGVLSTLDIAAVLAAP